MAHTEPHTETRAPNPSWPLAAVSRSVAVAAAAFTAWRKAVAGRKALADLTPDQLKDIGCSEPFKPKFVVKVGVGLMTDLMSMR
ncbi:DUF1127 domain-containing protein [Mesorhizobium sp. GbtcB19]|uniref:DUF1127 domain-containing protein n=1 Tax=Mesorhizobium sp. GbtcB19 TaxID=2824764 RepID=UPI001C2FCE82|nr:DUF1127 domain-containing protein [Mesorhizobium sp. GbtcB19]